MFALGLKIGNRMVLRNLKPRGKSLICLVGMRDVAEEAAQFLGYLVYMGAWLKVSTTSPLYVTASAAILKIRMVLSPESWDCIFFSRTSTHVLVVTTDARNTKESHSAR